MIWLVVIPLGVWVLLLSQRINALARRVAELELELFELRSAPPAREQPKPEQPKAPTPPPEPAAPQEELLLTEVVPDDVLVLDNPLPEASNDLEDTTPPEPATGARPRMHSPLLLNEPLSEPPRAEVTGTLPPPPPPPPQKPKAPPLRLDRWLAENGLAWIAGIAFAVGTIWVVSEVSQKAWFTPPLRLASAIVLGLIILGASEWTRRIGAAKPPGHPLVSALLAGAGIVVFYAATWAAHGIYHFIDWPVAASLLTLCALALIALSLLHGEALGVLAVALALLAPAIASSSLWPSAALTAYVGLVAMGGFALAIIRRWAWVALATVGGLYFWFFASIATDDVRRALALLSFASVGGLVVAFRAPIAEEKTTAGLSWSSVNNLGPSVAIGISSALLIWAWLVVGSVPNGMIAGPGLISIFHVVLATVGVRERKVTSAALVIAISAIVFGFMLYLRTRFAMNAVGADFYPMVLLASFACVAGALFANAERTERGLVAGAGAIGAGLLVLMGATSRAEWHSLAAWAPLFIGAALLFAAAWFSERSAEDKTTDIALTWWGGVGAVLVLLGVEAALPVETRTLGHAAAALVFAIGLAWRGWRVAGWAALSAGALSVAQALSPALIVPSIEDQIPLWVALLTYAGAATLTFGASTIVRRSGASVSTAEALSAAAVIITLTGVFVLLGWLTAREGTPLDAFSETSLRVLALMAAGVTLLPRIHETPGLIGAWRGHVLLGLGLLYAVFAPGLMMNPWWGGPGRAVVNGLPLINALAIAFAAPAALAFLAANRLYQRQRGFARAYAIAGGALAMIWLIMEIRHAFHSAAMAAPAVGLFESACYGLAFLAFALIVAVVARLRSRRNLLRPFTEDLTRAMRTVSWGGLVVAAAIMLLMQHPIWGLHNSDESNAFSTMLAVLAQPVAMILALALGRALSTSRDTDPARFAAASAAALFAWSFGHCVIRWLHHRGYMDDGAPMAILEGLAHALWPLIFVVAAAQFTRFVPGRDTTRAYLYDLQAIWSAAIWPALGFAALGLWLLYNPWWGASPAELLTPIGAVIALGAYIAAAALSYVAPDVPHVRAMKWMVPTATVACAAHLFVAATLIVRWAYHHPDGMVTAPSGDFELWTYSAVWAVFGGLALWLGAVRDDPALRWVGLFALLITTVKIFFVDIGRLSGLALGASAIGLGIVAAITAWVVRRNRPPPGPGDLVTVTPSARRERRRVRRRNSQ